MLLLKIYQKLTVGAIPKKNVFLTTIMHNYHLKSELLNPIERKTIALQCLYAGSANLSHKET